MNTDLHLIITVRPRRAPTLEEGKSYLCWVEDTMTDRRFWVVANYNPKRKEGTWLAIGDYTGDFSAELKILRFDELPDNPTE